MDARAERRVTSVRYHEIKGQGQRHRAHDDHVQAPPRRVPEFVVHREDVLVARKAEDEDRQVLERAEVGHDVPRLRVSVRRKHLAHDEERDAAALMEEKTQKCVVLITGTLVFLWLASMSYGLGCLLVFGLYGAREHVFVYAKDLLPDLPKPQKPGR